MKLDIEKNELVVGEENDVYEKELEAENVHYLLPQIIKEELEIDVKIRYASKKEKAKIVKIEDNKIKIQFAEPVKSITPGQSAVFYIDNILIGGGIIK